VHRCLFPSQVRRSRRRKIPGELTLFAFLWTELTFSLAPRHGRLWWILLLLPILTTSCNMHVCLIMCTYGFPDLCRLGGLEHWGDSDVLVCRYTAQSPVHRIWCAQVRADYSSFLSSSGCGDISESFRVSSVIVVITLTHIFCCPMSQFCNHINLFVNDKACSYSVNTNTVFVEFLL
jgi:hypothetical protein